MIKETYRFFIFFKKTLKSQLDWIDVELQHSIRTGVLKECNHKNQCFEGLRAEANNYTLDGRFSDIEKEIGKLIHTNIILEKSHNYYK